MANRERRCRVIDRHCPCRTPRPSRCDSVFFKQQRHMLFFSWRISVARIQLCSLFSLFI